MPSRSSKQLSLFDEPTQLLLNLSHQNNLTISTAALKHVSFCVLGSGSSGNCSVIQCADRLLLIDVGLGPRTVKNRLAAMGQSLDAVAAICLTHVDGDHFDPLWIKWIHARHARGHAVQLFVHERHVHAVHRVEEAKTLHRMGLLKHIDHRPFEVLSCSDEKTPGIIAAPVSLPHDVNGSQAFLLKLGRFSIGYATDLGQVPDELLQIFSGVDLLAIESNYDEQMQLASPRALHLKRRIMGSRGHLSNDQSFAAVRELLDRSHPRRPQFVVLLHRSRQCNCPKLLRELFEQDPRIKDALILAEQSEPTMWMRLEKK